MRLTSSLAPLPILDTPFAARDIPRRLLNLLPIFAPLSEEERVALERKMKRRTYKAGDALARQDSVASRLSILSAGVLIATRKHGAAIKEAMRFGPDDIFGEAGVLAGAPSLYGIRALTEATIYEIGKADLIRGRIR